MQITWTCIHTCVQIPLVVSPKSLYISTIHKNVVQAKCDKFESLNFFFPQSVLQFGKESYYGHEWLPAEQPRVFLVSSLHLFRLKRDGRQFDVGTKRFARKGLQQALWETSKPLYYS